MKQIYPHDVVTKNVLDYIQAVKWIDHLMGYKQRSAHEHFKDNPETYEGPEGNGQRTGYGLYLDYWHYVIDDMFYGDVRNDAMIGEYSFTEFYERTLGTYGELNWRTQIAKAWAEEYPDEYNIWMSW